MATKIGKRVARAVTNVLQERDRIEIRAMDALLSLVESPQQKSHGVKASRRVTPTGRTRNRTSVRTKRSQR